MHEESGKHIKTHLHTTWGLYVVSWNVILLILLLSRSASHEGGKSYNEVSAYHFQATKKRGKNLCFCCTTCSAVLADERSIGVLIHVESLKT
jgi:hypothetical protein